MVRASCSSCTWAAPVPVCRLKGSRLQGSMAPRTPPTATGTRYGNSTLPSRTITVRQAQPGASIRRQGLFMGSSRKKADRHRAAVMLAWVIPARSRPSPAMAAAGRASAPARTPAASSPRLHQPGLLTPARVSTPVPKARYRATPLLPTIHRVNSHTLPAPMRMRRIYMPTVVLSPSQSWKMSPTAETRQAVPAARCPARWSP